MKALDYSSQKVFVKYVDPQRPQPEEVIIQVKAASLAKISSSNSKEKIIVTDVVGIVQTEKNNLKNGAWVIALLPSDRECCLSEFLPVSICNLVSLPDSIDSFEALLVMQAAIRSYIGLAMQASITAGNSVLILDGANAENYVLIQLALLCGCRVLTTVQSIEEEQFLQNIDKVKVGNVGVAGWKSLTKFVSEETNDLGVDVVIDNGVNHSGDIADECLWNPEKYEVVNSLAPCGKWLTSEHQLQLDPVESCALYTKCASVCFLNHHSWILSNYRQGILLQIMDDVVKKLSNKLIRPPPYDVITLKDIEDGKPMPDLNDQIKCHVLKMP